MIWRVHYRRDNGPWRKVYKGGLAVALNRFRSVVGSIENIGRGGARLTRDKGKPGYCNSEVLLSFGRQVDGTWATLPLGMSLEAAVEIDNQPKRADHCELMPAAYGSRRGEGQT